MKFNKLMLVPIALAAVFSSSALGAVDKVGFVYVGPVGDHGWTYQHDIGRQAVEKAGYEVTYVESVPEGADAERVIRQLADTGHNIIFTTSFGYMDPTVKVATQFPNQYFEHATGYKRTDNVATYSARFYEGRHVAGLIAGKMTKTNQIGYIGAFPIPEVIRGINSVIIAARKVNPDAQIHVKWVNSWFDPGKEADAAKVLIDQGVDVLLQHTDSPAPVQVAQERGVYAIGQASDMKKFGPDAVLTSIVNNWGPYYVQRVEAIQNGSWQSQDVWGGFAADMVRLGEFHSQLPADVRKLAEDAVDGLISGSVHPFAGPIRDQQGGIVIPEGSHADDGTLLGMNYYVEGVIGSIPSQ